MAVQAELQVVGRFFGQTVEALTALSDALAQILPIRGVDA